MRVGRAVHSRRRSKRPAMRVGERHDGVEVALDPAPQAPVEDRAQAEVKLAQEAQAVVRRSHLARVGRAEQRIAPLAEAKRTAGRRLDGHRIAAGIGEGEGAAHRRIRRRTIEKALCLAPASATMGAGTTRGTVAIGKTGGEAMRTLKVNVFPGAMNLPLWAGIAQGFFAERNLAIETVYTPNSVAQLTGLIAGAFDLALTAIDNVIAYR